LRILSIPAAAALALYAGLAVLGATRLPRVGAWTLVASAAILVAGAIGLLARQLAAYLFASRVNSPNWTRIAPAEKPRGSP
jgi:hypothetical protein